MQLQFYIFAFLVLCAAELNSSQANSSISESLDYRTVGGRPVTIDKYPHHVSIQKRKKPWCNGSIYSENIVITAAQCVQGGRKKYQVVAGSSYRNGSNGFTARVKKIRMHKDFNPENFDNDIAVVLLRDSLPLNNVTMKAIELAEVTPKPREKVQVTGWVDPFEGGPNAEQLQKVNLFVIKDKVCNESYTGSITQSMVCGYGMGKGSCQNDIGGPMVKLGKLVGVVSQGEDCVDFELPSVYAKISYLRPWLLKTIEELGGSKPNSLSSNSSLATAES